MRTVLFVREIVAVVIAIAGLGLGHTSGRVAHTLELGGVRRGTAHSRRVVTWSGRLQMDQIMTRESLQLTSNLVLIRKVLPAVVVCVAYISGALGGPTVYLIRGTVRVAAKLVLHRLTMIDTVTHLRQG